MKRAKKTSKTKRKMELILGMLLISLGVGSVSAYFSDSEEVKNRVTIGKVDIALEEPKWDTLNKQEKENITPGRQMPKDPQIKNVGINDAFVFLTADVPVANVITANEDGTRNNKTETELFSWKTEQGWIQMGDAVCVKDKKDVTVAHRYLYAYGDKENCKALQKEQRTPVLFQNVTFANVIEGEKMPDGASMENAVLDIHMRAFAIQTTDLTKGDVTSPEAVWKVFSNQNPGIFSEDSVNTMQGETN